MKKSTSVLSLILVALLAGGGVYYWQQSEIASLEDWIEELQTKNQILEQAVNDLEEQMDRYTWEKHNLSFKVPEGLVVSDMAYVDLLVIGKEDYSTFEGELLGQVSIRVETEKDLNTLLAEMEADHELGLESTDSSDKEFSSEEVTIVNNTYWKVTYYSAFGDYMITKYLIESDEGVIEIVEGLDELKDSTQYILETLEF